MLKTDQGLHGSPWVASQVGLDACMANLMRPGMYGAYHHITIIPNSEQMPELPDRKKEMPDNSKDLITKMGIYDVVGGNDVQKTCAKQINIFHDVHTHAPAHTHTYWIIPVYYIQTCIQTS